ncbi:MAG: hypothetical protein EPN93_15055 [Spirochaetes bacterium]|nr:MAG: hypothetical protein EPN93_15055 [Spirochaetota bacterium]
MKRWHVYLLPVIFILIATLPAIAAEDTKMDKETLENKIEGWYPTGLPLINYSSDEGFGYGLRGYIYYDGNKDDPYYDVAPYFLQMYAQFFQTTNGVQYHELNVDMPYFMGTKFRIMTALVYEKNLNANYFGLGAKNATRPLTDNTGDTHSTYSGFLDYTEENEGYAKWYNYTITKPKYFFSLFRKLPANFQVMAGVEFKKVTIETWDGDKFDGDNQVETLLYRDRNIVPGYKGGWTNYARFGAGYDTRDYEPDPNRGVYVDYCIEVSTPALGSEYSFYKNTFGARTYLNPVKPLVFAFRVGYTTAAEDIPFYEQNWFGFPLSRKNGLGGNWTLRGYKADRFVGRTMTLANVEARWRFAGVSGAGQKFDFKLVGFADTGCVYDEAADPVTKPRFADYHHSFGGGLVIAWNQATIIHFYAGFSKEDMGIFINFEHVI